jgi:hypothetical protein
MRRIDIGRREGGTEIAGVVQPCLELVELFLGVGVARMDGIEGVDDVARVALQAVDLQFAESEERAGIDLDS